VGPTIDNRRRQVAPGTAFRTSETQLRVHGNSAASRDIASLLHPYNTNLKSHQAKGPVVITHGRGVNVYDGQGKEYNIEGLAGLLWCVSLGFSGPRLDTGLPRRFRVGVRAPSPQRFPWPNSRLAAPQPADAPKVPDWSTSSLSLSLALRQVSAAS
jgi:hypothetical protein